MMKMNLGGIVKNINNMNAEKNIKMELLYSDSLGAIYGNKKYCIAEVVSDCPENFISEMHNSLLMAENAANVNKVYTHLFTSLYEVWSFLQHATIVVEQEEEWHPFIQALFDLFSHEED